MEEGVITLWENEEKMKSEILSLDQLDFARQYTFADYLRWKFKERVELIKGFIHKMSPAPSPTHQSVTGFLTGTFFNFFQGKPCRFFAAPFDIRFPDSEKQTDDTSVYTVVQPDLCVICDFSRMDKRGYMGPPELVIEVFSPGNTKKELDLKFKLYEENGVKEYWFVHPVKKSIIIYSLQNGQYVGRHFSGEDEIRSILFPELIFRTADAFDRVFFALYEGLFKEPEVAYITPPSPLDDLDLSESYTFTDYMQWAFKEKVELIHGFVHKRSIDPVHQIVSRQLLFEMLDFFEDKPYKMYAGDTGVRLADSFAHEPGCNLVKPDFYVIADHRESSIRIPELIVEVLSPESTQKDIGIKYKLYAEAGVQEYWWVDPEDQVIYIHVLRNGEYVTLSPLTEDDEARSELFPDLKFSVKKVFEGINQILV